MHGPMNVKLLVLLWRVTTSRLLEKSVILFVKQVTNSRYKSLVIKINYINLNTIRVSSYVSALDCATYHNAHFSMLQHFAIHCRITTD